MGVKTITLRTGKFIITSGEEREQRIRE